MARIGQEVFLYGGQGLNGVMYGDMWRFDLENVNWSEQKQADLYGLVAEKQTQTGTSPGKICNHALIAYPAVNKLLLVTEQ